jgi:hypothetical protein
MIQLLQRVGPPAHPRLKREMTKDWYRWGTLYDLRQVASVSPASLMRHILTDSMAIPRSLGSEGHEGAQMSRLTQLREWRRGGEQGKGGKERKESVSTRATGQGERKRRTSRA